LREVQYLATVNVATLLTMDGDIVEDVKIALGAVAPTTIRAKSAEAILNSQKLSDSLIEKAAQAALDESRPRDDARGSAKYKKSIITVLVARAIKQAAEEGKAA